MRVSKIVRCGACVGRVPPSVVPGRWGVAKKSSKQVQDGCSHHFSTTTGDTDGLGRLPDANLFSHYVRPKWTAPLARDTQTNHTDQRHVTYSFGDDLRI